MGADLSSPVRTGNPLFAGIGDTCTARVDGALLQPSEDAHDVPGEPEALVEHFLDG